MKCYYYGPPSCSLLRAALALKKKAPCLGIPLAVLIAGALIALTPVAWILVRIGEIGHGLAGSIGYDSREW